jgi:hypothetical protein
VASGVGYYSFVGCLAMTSDWYSVPHYLRVCVRNQGGAAAGPFHVSVGSPIQSVFALSGLAAGDSTCTTFTLGVFGGNPLVFADSLNEVDESYETNNQATSAAPTATIPSTCTITPPPTRTPTRTPTATVTPTPTKTPSMGPAVPI